MVDERDVLILDRPMDGTTPSVGGEGAILLPNLPVAVLRPGAERPPGIQVLGERARYPLPLIRILQGIDFCIERKATAINLSVGPANPLPTSDEDPDPLVVAAHAAWEHGTPLIVAAGNKGKNGNDTLAFLARSPWCLAVGATDKDRRLLDTSSRGIPALSGPTVVSLGETRDLQYVSMPGVETPVILEDHAPVENAMRPREKFPRFAGPGTSYAAPRVTVVMAWLRVLINIVLSDVKSLRQGNWSDAVELAIPVIGICDTGIDPIAYAAHTPSPPGLLRHDDHQRSWYRELLNTLFNAHGIESRIASDSPGLKRALLSLARPLPGYAAHEAGAGFVSLEELEGAIRAFTPSRWLAMFTDESTRAKIDKAALDELDARLGPLWIDDAADRLASHIHGTPGALFVRVA